MTGKTIFDSKLEAYYQDAIYFGTLIEEYFNNCIQAFVTQDVKQAKELIKADKKNDEMQLALEEKSIRLLALQSPVASDLRKIVTSIKIFANLERIGDYAKHLAKLTVKTNRALFPEFVEPVASMAQQASAMIRDSITAYINDDEILALDTAKKDNEIDKLKKSIIAKLIMLQPKNDVEMKQVYRYISIAKDLERLGDHITTICEWVVFASRGEILDLGHLVNSDEEEVT
ncbi:MAG: phosphate transport system regulatory protein PhoU [Treponema sp. CETP13]|nr:MAG: phosphate transport system regulatory protein PhoU [Treponema sp. CETP13]